ncbi:hypothetical protein SAZ10_20050 [Mesorhizobium sp. BAC0120]|uniref:hypothetical protein n=1 Tax=Mesorhizobium sp. BAC0120 TaxID=3090670 RepID=UPI00298C6F28|nr:hypothetical protein [Mesorhizobium sp. BAC0120]MDW6024043.1 hypothetical protein [Mesorhizobium sp. BAC0120]
MESVMRRLPQVLAVSGTLLFVATSFSAAAPLNSMNEVGKALLACWNPPANSKGSSVTLIFSLKRDGTLIGPPRPTNISVAGDEQAKKHFLDEAVAALQHCTPLQFSPSIAQGIGGQVFAIQFASPKKDSLTPTN